MATQCPVCNKPTPSPNLIAHVNACLQASTTLLTPDDIPSPPPSPPSTPPSPSPQPPAQPETKPQNQSSPPNQTLSTWLSAQKLPKYTSGLLRAGYRTLADLVAKPPSDATLREKCAVTALGARRKILSELARLTHPSPTEPSPPCTQAPSACEDKDKKRRVWAIFEPGYRAPPTPPKRPRFAAPQQSYFTPSTAPPRPNGVAPSKAGAPSTPGKSKAPSRPRRHLLSHRVPGTSFTVDSFQAAKNDPSGSFFFLSHFHSDHYGGLRKSTLPRGARVLCTAVTASLVRTQLHIAAESILILPLAVQKDIPDPVAAHGSGIGVSVWLYEANHCPGAAMFLFRVWKTGRFVLHCGDCRFDRSIFEKHAKLAEVVRAKQLDYLYLDTTYCNPRYVFPPQPTVLSQVVSAARQEDSRTRKRCLFFFGTYSIGKEKVFLAVAEALNLKIYAGKRKRALLEQCGFGRRLTDRFVDSPGQARVHITGMGALSADGLREYASRNGLNNSFIGRGLAVVFKPTGWTFRGDPTKPSRVNRGADQAMVYEVAYSEHSSYEELVQFVTWSKPAKVIPTVGGRSAEETKKILTLLGHVDKSLRAVT